VCSVLKNNQSLICFLNAQLLSVWGMIRESMNVDIGEDYLSVAAKWLQKEKIYVINIASAAERNMVNKE
jgi:hypothetical protein